MTSRAIPLRVAMFTPVRERCGIADYSRLLVAALRDRADISGVHLVSPPETEGRASSVKAVRNYMADEREYRVLGARLCVGDVVHIQHQYFFFGGVAPHKNHLRAMLDAIPLPIVMTVHEIAGLPGGGWKQTLITRTNRLNFMHPGIRQIIVHTDADAEKLRLLGVAETKLNRLPVAVPKALPMPTASEAKATLGLAGKRVLMIFGFLSVKKGHRLAVKALTHLPEDVVLLVAGEKHPDDHSAGVQPVLQEDMLAAGLHDRVVFTGYLPDDRIPTIMAATDLALAPFTESSGSASLAHLFAYGLPVLASDIPPHREMLALVPGSVALFPANDPAALAEKAFELLTGDSKRDSLRNASAILREERSYARLAEQTTAIYRKALAH